LGHGGVDAHHQIIAPGISAIRHLPAADAIAAAEKTEKADVDAALRQQVSVDAQLAAFDRRAEAMREG